MIDWLSDLEAWLIPTFSPQGDGNYLMVMFVLSQLVAGELIPTFSPQGDGNPIGSYSLQHTGVLC